VAYHIFRATLQYHIAIYVIMITQNALNVKKGIIFLKMIELIV
jgi:hypothetical protein